MSVLVFIVCVTILIGLNIRFASHEVLCSDSKLDVEKLKLRNIEEKFSTNLYIKRSFFKSILLKSVSCKEARHQLPINKTIISCK